MCIAILQTKNSRIKKKTLKTCYHNNPDSMGLLWVQNGKLRIFKELDSFDTFYQRYLEVCNEVGKESNVVIHFRIATHGNIDIKNCHPHIINKNIGFVHNGIINIETNGLESDTVAFNKTILKEMPIDTFRTDGIYKLIDGFAWDSKFIFLDTSNRFKIIGKGTWIKGIWYSNDSYQRERIKYVSKYKGATTNYPKIIDKTKTHYLDATFEEEENPYCSEGFEDGFNNPYYWQGDGYNDYWYKDNEPLDGITDEQLDLMNLEELERLERIDKAEMKNMERKALSYKEKDNKELNKFIITKVNDIRKKLNGKFEGSK